MHVVTRLDMDEGGSSRYERWDLLLRVDTGIGKAKCKSSHGNLLLRKTRWISGTGQPLQDRDDSCVADSHFQSKPAPERHVCFGVAAVRSATFYDVGGTNHQTEGRTFLQHSRWSLGLGDLSSGTLVVRHARRLVLGVTGFGVRVGEFGLGNEE